MAKVSGTAVREERLRSLPLRGKCCMRNAGSPSSFYLFRPEEGFSVFIRNKVNGFIECVAKSCSCYRKETGLEMDAGRIKLSGAGIIFFNFNTPCT